MDAMARPGRLQRVACLAEVPPGLHQAAAAVLLTLADSDTLLWTDAMSEARQWMAFHAGARFTDHPGEADFLLATASPPPLAQLRPGSDEAPQDSATLIVQVGALAVEAGWRLTGPGIETRHSLRVEGLATGFLGQWQGNAARFPCGVDLVLTAGDTLAALPRTTRIEEAA
jgi:alpha-D-ribose 1-methylphosphonate 5-triphosphate synthase subunit PhnH